jgi:hypothetical protein
MSRKLLVVCSTVSLTLVHAASSQAQEPAPGYAPPATYAPPPAYAAPAPGYAAPAPYGAPAYPAPAYRPAGVHEHDGFYLRLAAGLGYLTNSASSGGSTMKVSGVGGTFGLAAGGIIARNLAVYGEIIGTSASDPSVEMGGVSGTMSGSMTLAGFGPGLAYYLDNNAYFSGTVLFSKLSAADDNGNDAGETDMGFGASLSGGKEWWVSDDWGLGVAGQLMLASMKEKDADYRWTSAVVSLLFSATYN